MSFRAPSSSLDSSEEEEQQSRFPSYHTTPGSTPPPPPPYPGATMSQPQQQSPTAQQLVAQLQQQQELIMQLQQQITQLQQQPPPPQQQAAPPPPPPPVQHIHAPHIEVARPPLFSGKKEELNGFISACKLYISILLEGATENTKINWVLSFVQGGVADAWKENIMEMQEFMDEGAPTVLEELWESLRINFGDADEESTAVGKLRLIEQGNKTCDEHVQEFRRIARDSGYDGRALVEEYKRSLNQKLRMALMMSE